MTYCRSEEAFDIARRVAIPQGGNGTPQSSPLAPVQLFRGIVCDRSAEVAARHVAPDFSCPEAQALHLAGAELGAEANALEPRAGKVDTVLTRYLSPAPERAPPERGKGLARCLATLKAPVLGQGIEGRQPDGAFKPGGALLRQHPLTPPAATPAPRLQPSAACGPVEFISLREAGHRP